MSQKYLKAVLLSSIVAVAIIAMIKLRQFSLTASSQPSALLVAAAASMQTVLQEITPLYQQSTANIQVNYNFGSSGSLQHQIEQGAPIDVFISAATTQMNTLQQENLLVPNTRKNLLTNRLVLITPTTATLKLTDFSQLVQPQIQRIAIGEPNSVPAGQYATEIFKTLNILDRVKSKLVLGNSVRAVLASVETGDADAGIVYISDAKTSDRVVISAIADERLHPPIVYPIAIFKSSKLLTSAQNYLNFLQTNQARTIFKKYGFGIATP